MYGLAGGCSTLFHALLLHPILVLAFGVSLTAYSIPSNPGPGDRFGTSKMLVQMEKDVLREHPELVPRVAELRQRFESVGFEPTDQELAGVLRYTDPCTYFTPKMLSPDDRKEAAWLLYLEKSRGSPRTPVRKTFLSYNPRQ